MFLLKTVMKHTMTSHYSVNERKSGGQARRGEHFQQSDRQSVEETTVFTQVNIFVDMTNLS